MIRFFAASSDITGGLIQLREEDAAHIRSLRLRPDELFTVCDGECTDYLCRLGERSAGSVAQIAAMYHSVGEPSVLCSIFIAFAKGDRLDYAIQKSVELGAYNIVLFPSERCVAIPGDIPKKIERLQRISLETAKQCGRGRIPAVSAVDSFEAAINQAAMQDETRKRIDCASVPDSTHIAVSSIQDETRKRTGCAFELSLFFYECEENLHLKEAMEQCGNDIKHISIVTGPEGGFEPRETEYAQSMGLISVSLGPRILRCETAPVVALSSVMFYTGNL